MVFVLRVCLPGQGTTGDQDVPLDRLGDDEQPDHHDDNDIGHNHFLGRRPSHGLYGISILMTLRDWRPPGNLTAKMAVSMER